MTLLADLRARLPQEPQAIVAREDVDTNLAEKAATTPPVRASVLLPIIHRPISNSSPSMLFTRRTATLARDVMPAS